MKKIIGMLVMVMVLAAGTQAATVTGLGIAERATFGATHVLTLTYADLATGTATNILTFTNLMAFASGDAVSCPWYVLKRSFGSTVTTDGVYTVTNVAIQVGDSAAADTFLTSTEMGKIANPVVVKRGVGDVITPTATAITTMTLQKVSLTDTNGVTASVVTNATAATAVTVVPGSSGTKVYSADDYLKVTVTGASGEALSSNVFGVVQVYLKKMPDKQ